MAWPLLAKRILQNSAGDVQPFHRASCSGARLLAATAHVNREAPKAVQLVISSLRPADRAAWEVLARGYKEFYATPTTDAEYAKAWHRLLANDGVHALGAFTEDHRLVGIAHYLFHTTVWAQTNCYLQDLFTLPSARGNGAGRALIEAVAVKAGERAAVRYYWHTQDHNQVARRLYDKVAKHVGFIRYDWPLRQPGT